MKCSEYFYQPTNILYDKLSFYLLFFFFAEKLGEFLLYSYIFNHKFHIFPIACYKIDKFGGCYRNIAKNSHPWGVLEQKSVNWNTHKSHPILGVELRALGVALGR